jgi:F-type H+-transporting ATPase subunit b
LKRRFSYYFVLCFIAAVLLVSFVPRSSAQDAAPASVQTNGAANNGSSSGRHPSTPVSPAQALHSERNSEEDPNIYRHSVAVQAIAHLLHVNVEVAARIFEYLNFSIVVLAILIPLVKFLPRAFRKRNEIIQEQLSEARTATEDANQRLSAVEQRLAKLDDEIEAIRRQMEQDSVTDESRIKAAMEEERKRIVDAASQEIEAATLAAQRGLKQLAAELAVNRAMGRLALTPELDRRLVDEFARDLGKEGRN